MSDPARRDELVARALRDLPVPDHGPNFWGSLEGRLTSVEAPSAPGDPAEDRSRGRRLDTGELPAVTALAHERVAHRSRRAPLLAAAAAVVVLATAVGLVMLAGRDGEPGNADQADGGVEATTTLAGGEAVVPPPDEPPATTASEPISTTTPMATPAGTAVAWLDALGSGDIETAAALTGPRTTQYIESLGPDITVESFLVDSQEGYGAWSGARGIDVTQIDLGTVDPIGGEMAIVVVSGAYPGEGGDVGRRVDVLPMVDDGQGWRIEHLAFDPARDGNVPVFTVPPEDENGLGGMDPSAEINVFVPANGTVFFRIDDGELGTDATSEVAGEPFALYNPPGDLPAGTHELVVVAVGDDGTIAPFGGTFLVES